MTSATGMMQEAAEPGFTVRPGWALWAPWWRTGAPSGYIAPSAASHSDNGRQSVAKYMFRTNYTESGLQGLLDEGGTGREAALRETVESAGGTLEGFYYAFGDYDLYLIAELPGETAATALSLNIAAAGALTVSVTVLLGPEDIDAAVAKSVAYRVPGG